VERRRARPRLPDCSASYTRKSWLPARSPRRLGRSAIFRQTRQLRPEQEPDESKVLDFVVLASCGVDGTAEGRQCPAKMPKRRPCKARRCRPSRTGRLPSSASIPAVDLGGLFAQSSRAQYSMARGHRGSGSCHGCQRLTNATSHDAILTLKTLAFGTAVNTFPGMMLPYFP